MERKLTLEILRAIDPGSTMGVMWLSSPIYDCSKTIHALNTDTLILEGTRNRVMPCECCVEPEEMWWEWEDLEDDEHEEVLVEVLKVMTKKLNRNSNSRK